MVTDVGVAEKPYCLKLVTKTNSIRSPNFSAICERAVLTKKDVFQKSQKVTKTLGYQKLSKIAQSGHTECDQSVNCDTTCGQSYKALYARNLRL